MNLIDGQLTRPIKSGRMLELQIGTQHGSGPQVDSAKLAKSDSKYYPGTRTKNTSVILRIYDVTKMVNEKYF